MTALQTEFRMDDSSVNGERLRRTPGAFIASPLRFDPLRFCQVPRKAPEERHALIAKAAYMRAQRRGFEAGHELEDWLAAEAEFDQRLLW